MSGRGWRTPPTSMESRRSPFRSSWLGGGNDARAYSEQEKTPTSYVSVHFSHLCYNEGAPLQTSSPSCNSTALAPRDLSLVHDLPSQDSRPNGGYCPAAQSRFGRFLALTVPSAVGLVTHVPLRLYPDEKSPLQCTATRRHRTQLYEILGSFEEISFAMYITLRKIHNSNQITLYTSYFPLSITTSNGYLYFWPL